MRTDRVVTLALFLVLSSVYFATGSGITSSNDGSHYALTRAIADEGRFTIETYDAYAEGNDIARREGRLFSDRPPGTALLTSVVYKIGHWLPSPLAPLPSRHDPENPRLLYVLLVPAWAGAGTAVILYWLLRELDVSVFAALTSSVFLGIATTHWKYSSVLFSHAPSALLVVLSIYLVIRLARAPSQPRALPAALGFAAGYAVLVEYSNALLVAAVALYLALSVRASSRNRWSDVVLFVAGGLLPAGFLAFYNTVNFGSPFALSYDFAVNYPWAGRFGETFSTPLGQGLRAMLVWGQGGGWCNPTCYNQGLLLLSPLLVLSVLGIRPFVRRARWEAVLILGLFLAYVTLFAKHRTFHGFTADGRYLTPYLALWCIPLAYLIDDLRAAAEYPAWQAAAYLALYGAAFLSMRNIFLHIGLSYNYELDLGQLSPIIASPTNWAYLFGQVFRNVRNLPLLWLAEACVLALRWGAWFVDQRLGRDP